MTEKYCNSSKSQQTPPIPVSLMEEYGISRGGIARQLDLAPNTVGNILMPDRFANVRFRTVIQVRARVERMLRAAGWEGKASHLWKEYDEQLEKAA